MLAAPAIDILSPIDEGEVACFRFFDQTFSLQCDRLDTLQQFDVLFSHYRIPATASVGCRYRCGYDGTSGRTILRGENSQRFEFGPGEPVGPFLNSYVLQTVIQRVTSHHLFHGAALSRSESGFVVIGDAMHGKSTLAVELLKRGFSFLADDIAAIERSTGMLTPFLRPIGLRSGTLSMHSDVAGLSLPSMPTMAEGVKKLLDVRGVWPDHVGRPCALRFLFVLTPSVEEYSEPSRVYVALRMVDSFLIEALERREGVLDVQLLRGDPFPILGIHSIRPMEHEIEALCRNHGALLLRLWKGRPWKPVFDGVARLVPLRSSVAARALMQHARGGHSSTLVSEIYGGDVGLLYLDLVRLLSSVDCYQLTLGNLSAMADLICDAAA